MTSSRKKAGAPAAPANPAAPAAAEDFSIDGKTLRIRSVAKTGRRRAGLAFGPEVAELAADELTDDQVGALLSDPLLIVEIV